MPNLKIPIGSITFLINDPKDDWLSEEEVEYLSSLIHQRFSERLSESELRGVLSIDEVRTGRGCITVTIGLSAVVVSAGVMTAKAVTAFLKDYPNIRAGAIQLAKDLNGLRVKLQRWATAHTTWMWQHNLIDQTEAARRVSRQVKPK